MDPYIEDEFFWSDFHTSMIGVMRETLNGVLPNSYVAAADRHVWVQERNGDEVGHLGSSDVHVADAGGEPGAAAVATMTKQVAAPVTVVLPMTRADGNRYLRILDRRRRRVVTVIELLSRANKLSTGYGIAYRAKRADYLASDLNLVEIDLLRSGVRPPVNDPPPARSDYCITVCTATGFPQAGYWPLSVRDTLPLVPIPLEPDDDPVLLDLRACIDRVYDGGRYYSEIDYSQPPSPPLGEADATWARELLTARSKA